MRETIQRLLAREISSNSIALATGVSQAVISKLRNRKKELGNLSLNSAEKLYNYQKGLNAMDKIIKLENQNNIVLIDSLGQYFTDIENDNNGRFNVEYALLNKVEHDTGSIYYEVGVYRTEEVSFGEEVTEDNVSELEDRWLQTDQQGENYIESVFFENEQDATDYITLVLKGNKNFADAAKAVGVIK
ncbi:hypothetical protein RCO12_04805 [Staphylococcus coagulans]|uniref:XRE family transcriptional regulator n=1 Tax=Staphylococcus coagulans TaxID=74706 RepID=A0ABU1EXA2_9STAP|nr:hypothetical protein [Staphylococcus coagulans]MDR5602752.1 hypothetical protein [Staphylococcus coagulans]MDR9833913.1 hypothetical protein [Staphylococcus coagulans]